MKVFVGHLKVFDSYEWYCSCCQDITPVELNLSWLLAGKPYVYDNEKYDFQWFARCYNCGQQHFSGSFSCPDCGFNNVPDSFYFYIGKRFFDCTAYDYSTRDIYGKLPWWAKLLKAKIYPVYGDSGYNYGSESYDWEETHWCPYCKKEFSFVNGTYINIKGK